MAVFAALVFALASLGSTLPLHSLSDVLRAFGEESALNGLQRGASWLVNTSQVQTAALPSDCNDEYYEAYKGHWRGAFRGEYQAGGGTFGFFGPTWHGGQAVKALVHAARAIKAHRGTSMSTTVDSWVLSAALGADFILDKQITTGPNAGLLIALEQASPDVNMPSTSTQLESLDGLLELSDYTRNTTLADRALATAKWIRDNAYMPEHLATLPDYNFSGLMWDIYNQTVPLVGIFVPR